MFEKFHDTLVPHVRAWARHGIHFGALSVPRTLEEYTRCFATACLNVGPYRMPGMAALLRLQEQIPPAFRFTVAVTEETLMYRFPYGHPDRAKQGERNSCFLDATVLEERVFPALQVLASHVGMVLLRLAPVYPTEGYPFGSFLRAVDRFLGALPSGYSYALEHCNQEYVLPEYLACLRAHGITHALHRYPGGPPIVDQLQTPGILTADTAVLRAAAACSPVDDDLQIGIREVVRQCVEEKKWLLFYVDDHVPAGVPAAMMELMTMLDPELAKLSPIRRKAA
jgi:uncharacterized protein YecE (DUF72 family)